VIAFLDGQLPEKDLAGTIAQNTRALVKKQRTWFRTQMPEHRVIMAEAISDAAKLFA
jgi:tRNA dimethylallyltransferase